MASSAVQRQASTETTSSSSAASLLGRESVSSPVGPPEANPAYSRTPSATGTSSATSTLASTDAGKSTGDLARSLSGRRAPSNNYGLLVPRVHGFRSSNDLTEDSTVAWEDSLTIAAIRCDRRATEGQRGPIVRWD